MKKWIFQLFFGSDGLGESMFHMLTIRKQVVAKHAANKELRKKLVEDEKIAIGLKFNYDQHRENLEKAYSLDLD